MKFMRFDVFYRLCINLRLLRYSLNGVFMTLPQTPPLWQLTDHMRAATQRCADNENKTCSAFRSWNTAMLISQTLCKYYKCREQAVGPRSQISGKYVAGRRSAIQSRNIETLFSVQVCMSIRDHQGR